MSSADQGEKVRIALEERCDVAGPVTVRFEPSRLDPVQDAATVGRQVSDSGGAIIFAIERVCGR